MTEPLPGEGRAAELRRSFDQSFVLPPPGRAEETVDLLAIRVAGDSYAIRLKDVDGLVSGRRIVPVPVGAPDCLGVAGIRGVPVPVFNLAALLGYGLGDELPKWILLCGREDPLALAFAGFEGYLRVPRASIRADAAAGAAQPYATEVASTSTATRAVVAIPALVTMIRNRVGRSRSGREQ